MKAFQNDSPWPSNAAAGPSNAATGPSRPTTRAFAREMSSHTSSIPLRNGQPSSTTTPAVPSEQVQTASTSEAGPLAPQAMALHAPTPVSPTPVLDLTNVGSALASPATVATDAEGDGASAPGQKSESQRRAPPERGLEG